MSREVQVRFCESRGVRFPPATHLVILVRGGRRHAEALREQAATVLAPRGLRLSEAKTLITHIDEGLDFLGWRIQRHRRKGDTRRFVYTYPSNKALASITGKVRAICRQDQNLDLAIVLHQLNSVLRGWTAYFRPGVSFKTFRYLRLHLAAGHLPAAPKTPPGHLEGTPPTLLRRRMVPSEGEVTLFNPTDAGTTRYPYRGTRIPSPWPLAA